MALKLSEIQEKGLQMQINTGISDKTFGGTFASSTPYCSINTIPVQDRPAERWVKQNSCKKKNLGKGGNAKSERCLLPDRLTEHNKDYITTQCKTPVNSQLPATEIKDMG